MNTDEKQTGEIKQKAVNFKIEFSLWEQFKKKVKENDSDASKVLRSFIRSYVDETNPRKRG